MILMLSGINSFKTIKEVIRGYTETVKRNKSIQNLTLLTF